MFVEMISVAIFLALGLMVFLAVDLIRRRRRTTYAQGAGLELDESSGQPRERKPPNVLTQAFAGIVPQSKSEIQKIEYDLRRAGYYSPTALIEYMATRNSLIIAVIVVTGSLAVLADPGTSIPELLLMLGFGTSILGYGLPRMLLHRQANQRAERIQRGLPDALDLITMCLTGGITLPKSLERTTGELKQSHPDVAVEFEIIRRHADADTMPNALRQFAKRIDAPDVNALAALVSQTTRMGTHVATAVCDYADTVRLTHRQRAEEAAGKTSIKILFPVIFCLAPPVYILLCGPPMIKLYTFIKGAHEEDGVLSSQRLSSLEPLPTGDLEELLEARAAAITAGNENTGQDFIDAAASPDTTND